MRIIKKIIIAFSMYSRLPMPSFKWEEEDMAHVIDFLPLIGLVISAAGYAVIWISECLNIPEISMSLMLIIMPVLLTGGFHVDGFMDVQDARNSYQNKEKKLEILKDPHIGAFAVIKLITVGIVWTAFIYILLDKCIKGENNAYLLIYCLSFPFVRALCAIVSIMLKPAKKQGMLSLETGDTGRGDMFFLSVQALTLFAVFICIDLPAGLVCMAVLFLFTLYYKNMCYREFGGVTGDTAGYYVVSGECMITVALGILSVFHI